MLFLMDSIVMEKDLQMYEGEVVVSTKRKSLKTLRKKRMNQGKNTEEKEEEEGLRGSRKVWKGKCQFIL